MIAPILTCSPNRGELSSYIRLKVRYKYYKKQHLFWPGAAHMPVMV